MKHFTGKFQSWGMWLKITGLVLPMLAAGCVSHPSATTVQPWPGPPPAGYSMLMLYWTKTRWDQSGGGPWIYINNVKAFKLHTNHYSWVYVHAGTNTFSTEWGFKFFGWNPLSGLNMKNDIPFEDGKSYYLRLRNWANDYYYAVKINVEVDQVSEKTANQEAKTCWFTKPLVSQIDGPLKPPENPKIQAEMKPPPHP